MQGKKKIETSTKQDHSLKNNHKEKGEQHGDFSPSEKT